MLATAVVTVGAALFQYAKQKDEDRKLDLQKEKCAAFVGFINSLEVIFNHHIYASHEKQAEKLLEVKSAFNELYLRARSRNFRHFVELMGCTTAHANVLDARRAGRDKTEQGTDATDEGLEKSRKNFCAALLKAVNSARADFGYETDPLGDLTSVEFFELPPAPASQAAGEPSDSKSTLPKKVAIYELADANSAAASDP